MHVAGSETCNLQPPTCNHTPFHPTSDDRTGNATAPVPRPLLLHKRVTPLAGWCPSTETPLNDCNPAKRLRPMVAVTQSPHRRQRPGLIEPGSAETPSVRPRFAASCRHPPSTNRKETHPGNTLPHNRSCIARTRKRVRAFFVVSLKPAWGVSPMSRARWPPREN